MVQRTSCIRNVATHGATAAQPWLQSMYDAELQWLSSNLVCNQTIALLGLGQTGFSKYYCQCVNIFFYSPGISRKNRCSTTLLCPYFSFFFWDQGLQKYTISLISSWMTKGQEKNTDKIVMKPKFWYEEGPWLRVYWHYLHCGTFSFFLCILWIKDEKITS